jgi:uncharacterized protein YbjT (DUF2867 family)
MLPRILVTGAPGNVGTPLVRDLQAADVPFRVGARNPEKARAALGDPVDAVRFDFQDAATFPAALADVDRVFLVRPPTLANVQRDFVPFITAAAAAGVQQMVFLSVQGVENSRFIPHARIEAAIEQSGMDHTFLRAGFFMQNLTTTHAAEIRERSEIALPVGSAKTAFIDTRDIAAVAARALTEDGHGANSYTLTGADALTYDEVAAIMTDVLGRPVMYTNVTPPEFVIRQVRGGMGWGFALVVMGLYVATRFGNAEQVTDDVRRSLGREPISFEQFARDHREVWLRGD